MNENLEIYEKLYEACVRARESNKLDTIRMMMLQIPQVPRGLKRQPIKLEIVDVDQYKDSIKNVDR